MMDELGCSLLSGSGEEHNCSLGVLRVAAEPLQVSIEIPAGAECGQRISVEVAGQRLELAVPEGAAAGDCVTVAVQQEERAYSVLWMTRPEIAVGDLLSAKLCC